MSQALLSNGCRISVVQSYLTWTYSLKNPLLPEFFFTHASSEYGRVFGIHFMGCSSTRLSTSNDLPQPIPTTTRRHSTRVSAFPD